MSSLDTTCPGAKNVNLTKPVRLVWESGGVSDCLAMISEGIHYLLTRGQQSIRIAGDGLSLGCSDVQAKPSASLWG